MENLVFSLPTDVLEHIQGFMDAKEAARSSILCKRLYRSWSRINKVKLDQRHFQQPDRFWTHATDTIERYISERLMVESISIHILSGSESMYKAKSLIEHSAKMLPIEMKIDLLNEEMIIQIPDEILLSEKIESLSITGGTLAIGPELQVNCSTIKSLHLHPYAVIGHIGGFVYNYVMKCPSLVHLNCDAFMVSFYDPRLCSSFHLLESMTLLDMRNRGPMYFADLTRMFPRLRTISIRGIHNCNSLRICSDTLETLSIVEPFRRVSVVVNAPNLHRFHSECVAWSSFAFEAHCMEWLCDASVFCYQTNKSWFLSLRKLLQCFKSSTLLVSIRAHFDDPAHVSEFFDDGSIIPVEVLELRSEMPTPGLIPSLLRICKPKSLKYNGIVTADLDELLQI